MILESILHKSGNRWVICTGLSQVEHTILKMKFDYDVLYKTNPERLTEELNNRRSYYSNNPRVVVDDVKKVIKK